MTVAAPVLPDPRKGSRTSPSGGESAFTRPWTRPIGNWHGCCVFSTLLAFYSYSGPIAMPLNRAELGGPLYKTVNFIPHNIREGFHALYAVRSAIELGCRTMSSVFNADDNDIPFFGSRVRPQAELQRRALGGARARSASQCSAQRRRRGGHRSRFEKHAAAAFYSYSARHAPQPGRVGRAAGQLHPAQYPRGLSCTLSAGAPRLGPGTAVG